MGMIRAIMMAKLTGSGSGSGGGSGGGGGGGGGAEKKDVNFIDYDGTILHSYTAEEFAALTELPENPSRAGLTAQGWNWTLADAKAYVANYGKLWIGQMYITDDGKTRIYCHFENGRLAPYLGLGVNGTVVVDWGDGSDADTLTGTSLTTTVHVQHTYAAAGDYVITLIVTNGSFNFIGTSNTSNILKKSTVSSSNVNQVYTNAIRKIEIGSGAGIGDYAFFCCYGLASIMIPPSVTSIGNYAFNSCYGLASMVIPFGVTDIGNYAFKSCYAIASVTIPPSVTSIGSGVFNVCYNLASVTIPPSMTSIGDGMFNACSGLISIVIPSSVTNIAGAALSYCSSLASIVIPADVASIGTNAFNACYGMAEYHMLPTTPPTLGTTAFKSIPSDCVIYVPYSEDHSILEAYKTATNWSAYASYMREEPQAA